MDKTAIEAIQALAHADQVNNIIANTGRSAVALPKDYSLSDLEKFKDKPNLFRAHYTTHLIDEFTSYLNINGGKDTGIFVDTEKSTAHAVINMGSADRPQWGSHKATVTLKKTPEFDNLFKANLLHLGQLEFIDFIEDWPECIVFVDGTDEAKPMPPAAAIASIRKLTIQKQSESTTEAGDFAANVSSTDLIELKAQGNNPPKGFTFTCYPYEGLSQIRIECRLRAITNGKDVKLKYRILALDRIIDDIGVEFKEHLCAKITIPAAQIYCGNMAYQK